MSPEELLEVIKTRRSVRKFAPDAVPERDINLIVTAASWAPSGTNRQNWAFIAVTSAEAKKKMSEAVEAAIREAAGKIGLADAKNVFMNYAMNFSFFGEAPAVIAVIQKPYESVTQKILQRYKVRVKSSTAGVQGPAAAVENMLLMAHVLGYGTCWMTGPLIAKDSLESVLGIIPPDELMALVPIGKPCQRLTPPPRKPAEELLRYL